MGFQLYTHTEMESSFLIRIRFPPTKKQTEANRLKRHAKWGRGEQGGGLSCSVKVSLKKARKEKHFVFHFKIAVRLV